jgi:hypothetical protein
MKNLSFNDKNNKNSTIKTERSERRPSSRLSALTNQPNVFQNGKERTPPVISAFCVDKSDERASK